MASDKELLKNTLKDLLEHQLKEFKSFLCDDYKDCVYKSELESADRLDTVDKMVACFGPEEAVKTTVKILRKMNQNELAKQLEDRKKDNSKATQTETTQTEITQIEATQTETTQTEITQIEITLIEATQTETTQTEITQIEITQIEATRTETTQIEATQIEVTQTEVTQTETTQTETTQTETTQIEATQIEVTQTEVTQTETTQTEATQIEATQIEATQIEVTQTEITQTEATQIEVTQTETTQIEVTQTEITQTETTQSPVVRLKARLKLDYKQILVGNHEKGHLQNLNNIYTDLYVVENETGGALNDHEVMQIESSHNRLKEKEMGIKCNDMFKAQRDTDHKNRKVLTMGIAGVGKTVSVNKFILDWAEEKENQEIAFIFPLPFRRLNMIKNEEKYSLIDLINKYFFTSPEELSSLPKGEVMFIFDGLDEYRFPLNFDDDDGLIDVNKKTSVSKIITNLIKRDLVPFALIWITSRPAAANLVPRDYITLTEVRGFTDEQKELYFRKNNPQNAENIISHIRKSRSLYIMCHIPVFCWILLTVLKDQFSRKSNEKIPTTLTGMYKRFLLIQHQQMKKKYSSNTVVNSPNAEARSFDKVFQKLGKLAFRQLRKGHLFFYKEDLEACGLCVREGSVFSGLCTLIFQEEQFSVEKVYSFVHLSVQEFIAALYVFFKFRCSRRNAFLESCGASLIWRLFKKPLFRLHQDAINQALQSKNGHLDLFLRFLLGLSLESNNRDLNELLPGLELRPEYPKKTTDYIKEKIKMEKSAERTINLFFCLSELKDDFVEEIQGNLSSGHLSAQNLSSVEWSALVFVLLMSEETQKKFELQKYRRSDEALMRLLPVIKNTEKALLQCCNLTDQSCNSLSSALQSSNSFLRDLDLSSNNLRDSGVKLLSDGLKSSDCQLKTLRLQCCYLTDQSCDGLSSALQSSNSSLRELDLRNNDLRDSGVELLSDGLKSPNCQLEILSLQCCNLTAQSCKSLSSALRSSNSIKELDLSNNDLQDSGIKLLSGGLSHIKKLRWWKLSGCMVTEEGFHCVSSALSSNPSHLEELDLSYNHPGDSGVKMISDKLEDPNCSLNKLNVDQGGEAMITAGLKKYSCFLTLDPNTVNTDLSLSEENRRVKNGEEKLPYPDHPDRFDHYHQVLCSESVCGRRYWEVEWSGHKDVCISVSYKSIGRKGDGDECWLASNNQSWTLLCSPNTYSFWHNKIDSDSPVKPMSVSRSGVNEECVYRTGVYVDHSAGTLSFYSVSDTMSLIHTVQTTFTEPLYPAFGVDPGSSLKLC